MKTDYQLFRGIAVCVVAWLSVLIVAPAGSVAAADDASHSHFEKTLRDRNIKPDADGLNAYFRSLHPSENQRQRAAKLIQQLGSTDSFAVREEALGKLLVLPVLPTEALVKASQGSDPEVRWRAKKILQEGKPESERVLYAAFKTVQENKISGVTDELLRAVVLCDKPHLRYAAREALKATARKGDAPALLRSMSHDNVELRIAAVEGFGAASGKDSLPYLRTLFEDPDDRVKLAAARTAANNGDRECLNVLLKLLSSDDRLSRAAANVALRQASGKFFGFAAYDTPEKRKAAVAKWKTWVDGDGQTAKLNIPLEIYGAGTSYLAGNTLLAFGYNNRVAEYDPTGKEVWSYTGGQGVWSAEKLANGNLLLACYSQDRVIEVDPDKNIVWTRQGGYPVNAKQLANGNILIAEHNGKRVVEVDREKKVVWQYRTKGNCTDAHRLPNGNTLVADYGRPIEEVAPDGQVVWQYPAASTWGCQPLPNGNVLIAELNGRAIEVTREKKIIWELKEQNACDVFRLPNGNTLVTGHNRAVEVTPNKEVVWSKAGFSYGTARR